MSSAPAPSGNAGFTLVEALVATLLMGLIITALGTVTAQWLPNWDRGVARLQQIEAVAAGLDRLVADISVAETVSAGGATNLPFFDGGESSLIFVRTTLNPNVAAGLEVVRIAGTSDERGPLILRGTAVFPPYLGEAGGADSLLFTDAVVLIRAPYRVAFSYAGADRVWHEAWRKQSELPRAVRIRLRDAATSITLAASTSTLVHADLPARCAWAKQVTDCPELGGQALPAATVSPDGR
jgi:general secretion pathway protein J